MRTLRERVRDWPGEMDLADNSRATETPAGGTARGAGEGQRDEDTNSAREKLAEAFFTDSLGWPISRSDKPRKPMIQRRRGRYILTSSDPTNLTTRPATLVLGARVQPSRSRRYLGLAVEPRGAGLDRRSQFPLFLDVVYRAEVGARWAGAPMEADKIHVVAGSGLEVEDRAPAISSK